ncbi:Flp pilus assembly protein RcpC/CpaB [Thermanaeromonas toyohensis ToBE]|uniref:Flp pilus assembly protein RcpC/CpaB n=1 Tax=Thermanaeromonas toyohensis ToBE TaxID=698762 RepID=A0A1W1VTS8_9FIRM|nr:Flp pilus assembly protein CpaB [Thermanaeromonas toyohensis]SMB96511.1 Flp pilus assembly protein RcpC/CpaB [Thermanaeromonas toyohensis ToBE]
MRFSVKSPKFYAFRNQVPLIVAIVVGLAVALGSARFLLGYAKTQHETVRVPVPARDIAPYTVISPGDITWRDVIKGAEEAGAVRDPREVVGRVALSPLYRGEQIRKERLADPSFVTGRQVVAVSIDVARCVGGILVAGDLVDVWWVPDPGQPERWVLVATDAVVLDVRDSSGRTVLPQGGLVQQAIGGVVQSSPSNPPAVAVLAVRTEEVQKVIGGASPKSQFVVLAKKFISSNAGGISANANLKGNTETESPAGARR